MKKPKSFRNTVFIILLLFMSAVTVFETLSQLKYANYSKVIPVSIDHMEKMDVQSLQEMMSVGIRLDIAGYNYYLMDCTIENQTTVDGSFYPYDAFCSADRKYQYYAMDTISAQRYQGGHYQWYVPAGENIQVSLILQADKNGAGIMADENPSVTAQFPKE